MGRPDEYDAGTHLPPTSEWGIDPLFWAHVKLTVSEVVGVDAVLRPADGTKGAVHFYRGRPTRKCEMMGYVVTLNVRDNKTIFTSTWHSEVKGNMLCVASKAS